MQADGCCVRGSLSRYTKSKLEISIVESLWHDLSRETLSNWEPGVKTGNERPCSAERRRGAPDALVRGPLGNEMELKLRPKCGTFTLGNPLLRVRCEHWSYRHSIALLASRKQQLRQ